MLIPQETIKKVVDEVRKTYQRVSVYERNLEIYGYRSGKGVSWGINTIEKGCVLRAIRTPEDHDICMEINC